MGRGGGWGLVKKKGTNYGAFGYAPEEHGIRQPVMQTRPQGSSKQRGTGKLEKELLEHCWPVAHRTNKRSAGGLAAHFITKASKPKHQPAASRR